MIRSAPVRSLRGILAGVGMLSVFASFVVVITCWYVAHERTYYWWDYAVHQDLAIRTALAFQRSFSEGWEAVGRTSPEDYNAFFAVPLVPFIRALGPTRLAYELGLAITYLLPFALTLGSIAAALIRGPRGAVFWTTAALTLLTPMTWIPLLRGYPDIGAALLVALAVRLCVSDATLRRPRTIVLVGSLLAVAAIYRRHFLFAGPALLASTALCALVDEAPGLRSQPREAAWRLLAVSVRILLAAATGGAFALLLARPVALRWFKHGFYGLYTAYLVPVPGLLRWCVESYGWLAWIGAAAGLVAGVMTGVVDRRRTWLVGGFGAIAVLQWFAIVREFGEQYTLHFTPTIVLGLAALGWTLWTKRGGLGHLVQATGALYVATNFVFGMADLRVTQQTVPLRFALSANWPPMAHPDPPGVGRLVEGLRRMTGPDDPVFVVASSQTLNPDLLLNAERMLYGWEEARLQIVHSPAVDSRDQYPLEPLLQARFVVVAHPLQLHLPAAEQRVVQVVYDMFQEHVAMARDFTPVQELFVLRGAATVRIYQRVRLSSFETGLSTLRYMQERIPRPPGSQPDWAVLSGRFPAWAYRRADGTCTLIWHPTQAGEVPAAIALFLGTPPATIHARGTFQFVDSRCQGAAIAFGFLTPDGSVIDAGVPGVARRPGQPGAFEASLASRPASRLLLRLTAAEGQTSIDFCLLRIDCLAVS